MQLLKDSRVNNLFGRCSVGVDSKSRTVETLSQHVCMLLTKVIQDLQAGIVLLG